MYQTYADRINIASEIASILHGIKDIKASGNEVELSLRKSLSKFLPFNTELSNGHIIDFNSQISKQYDFILSNKEYANKLFRAKDSTELVIYERVYCIGEVKKTWNLGNLIDTMVSIKDLKNRLNRNAVDSTTLITGKSNIKLNAELTNLPLRNPLFTFAFAVNSDGMLHKLQQTYSQDPFSPFLPNVTVILNEGLFVMVSKDKLDDGTVEFILHPSYKNDPEKYEWKFIESKSGGKNFGYLYYLLLEHLSTTILEVPNYMRYASSLLEIDAEDISSLDEL